jgi:hypothetical protein
MASAKDCKTPTARPCSPRRRSPERSPRTTAAAARRKRTPSPPPKTATAISVATATATSVPTESPALHPKRWNVDDLLSHVRVCRLGPSGGVRKRGIDTSKLVPPIDPSDEAKTMAGRNTSVYVVGEAMKELETNPNATLSGELTRFMITGWPCFEPRFLRGRLEVFGSADDDKSKRILGFEALVRLDVQMKNDPTGGFILFDMPSEYARAIDCVHLMFTTESTAEKFTGSEITVILSGDGMDDFFEMDLYASFRPTSVRNTCHSIVISSVSSMLRGYGNLYFVLYTRRKHTGQFMTEEQQLACESLGDHEVVEKWFGPIPTGNDTFTFSFPDVARFQTARVLLETRPAAKSGDSSEPLFIAASDLLAIE